MSKSSRFCLTFLCFACWLLPASAQSNWTWPSIPGCLADPEIQTQGKTDYTSPVCTLYDRLLASDQLDLTLKSARRMNADMDGVLYPAFTPGTEVISFILTQRFNSAFTGPSVLVRVSSSTVGARSGSWWTTLDSVTVDGHLMDAAAIQAKLALPNTPSCLAYADSVKPGIRAYMGVIAPAFGQPGGGVEFWFPPDAVTATRFEQIPGAHCNLGR
jgi:hypothetical protein